MSSISRFATSGSSSRSCSRTSRSSRFHDRSSASSSSARAGASGTPRRTATRCATPRAVGSTVNVARHAVRARDARCRPSARSSARIGSPSAIGLPSRVAATERRLERERDDVTARELRAVGRGLDLRARRALLVARVPADEHAGLVGDDAVDARVAHLQPRARVVDGVGHYRDAGRVELLDHRAPRRELVPGRVVGDDVQRARGRDRVGVQRAAQQAQPQRGLDRERVPQDLLVEGLQQHAADQPALADHADDRAPSPTRLRPLDLEQQVGRAALELVQRGREARQRLAGERGREPGAGVEPSSSDDGSDGSAPVPSVVRSTVLSCMTYGTPSALVATSISTQSAPARAPAAIAASVFSGVIDE